MGDIGKPASVFFAPDGDCTELAVPIRMILMPPLTDCPAVKLLLEGLGTVELEPLGAGELATPDARRLRMRKTLKSAAFNILKSAGKFVVEQAASQVPFGSIAVAFCEDTLSRIKVMKENKEAVAELTNVSRSL